MIILIILFASQIIAKPLNPKRVIYAMNCGAPSSYKGPSGILYEKDVQADPDTIVADYNLNSEVSSQIIKYTREPEIYLTERHAYKSFGYQLPLQKEGVYTLILKFAEMYFDAKQKRVFHVKLGENKVIENLDVVARVGKYAADDEYIEFEYLAGQIFFNGTLCADGVKNGKLQLSLEKTKFDNPYIHGLVLVIGSLNETDAGDYQNMKNNWEKIQKEEKNRQESERLKKSEKRVKRKEKVKMRNDHLNEQENEFEFEDLTNNSEPQEIQINRGSLKSLIIGPIGTGTLWIGLFIGIFILKSIYNKVESYSFSEIEMEEETIQSKLTSNLAKESGDSKKKAKKITQKKQQ